MVITTIVTITAVMLATSVVLVAACVAAHTIRNIPNTFLVVLANYSLLIVAGKTGVGMRIVTRMAGCTLPICATMVDGKAVAECCPREGGRIVTG